MNMEKVMLLCTILCLALVRTYASYSESRAKELVWAASLAYCTEKKVMKQDCSSATFQTEKMGMRPIHAHDNHQFFDPISYSILLRKAKKEIIIGFSGTVANIQLIHEITRNLPVHYKLHEVEDAYVFSYFYNHYNKYFRKDFMEQLQKINKEYPGYDFYFTGHSLGGAMTMHAAADAILSGTLKGHKVQVYTYGQPRVGNHQFLDAFVPKLDGYYRLVNYTDIVPMVPPCIIDLLGRCISDGVLPVYAWHDPQEIFYDKNGKKHECDKKNGEDMKCSDGIFSDSVDHHLYYLGVDVGAEGYLPNKTEGAF